MCSHLSVLFAGISLQVNYLLRCINMIKLKDLLLEKIVLDVNVGDTILVGKFKNKKMKIKNIGKDKHGMPTINGRKATTFRIHKTVNIFDKGFNEKIDRDAEGYGKYDDPDDSDFDEPSKTKKLEGKSTYKQIMEM